MQDYLLSIIEGEKKGPVAFFLRGLFCLLSWTYNLGLKIYLGIYSVGLRKRKRFPIPVISVGNLTVGGTGKTPMTQRVCGLLREHNIKPVVLTRGYRGENEFGAAIVSDGKRVLLSAKAAGDEANMLASLMPKVPVVAGKDRRITGQMAIDTFHPDVLVLDDGMQFYQLHRNCDIILIDSERPFHNGWTFPRGLLREPVTHLRRGQCAVVTNADRVSTEALSNLKVRINRIAPAVPVFTARYLAIDLKGLDGRETFPLEWLAGRKICGYCALGKPDGFRSQLERAGAEIVHWVTPRDHHDATMAELSEIMSAAVNAGAEAIVVTDKDAVKLPPVMRPLPFYKLQVDMIVDEQDEFIRLLLEKAEVRGSIG